MDGHSHGHQPTLMVRAARLPVDRLGVLTLVAEGFARLLVSFGGRLERLHKDGAGRQCELGQDRSLQLADRLLARQRQLPDRLDH